MDIGEKKLVRGRPRKAPQEGQRYLVSARLTPYIREKVEAAANRNGRSLAQEVEMRVTQSFKDDEVLGGQDTAMLLRTLAVVIWNLESRSGKSWREDYLTALGVKAALQRALLALSPPSPESDLNLPLGDVLDHGKLDTDTKKRLEKYEAELNRAYALGDALMIGALRVTPELKSSKK